MYFGHGNMQTDYKMFDENLVSVNDEKDLEILMTREMKSSNHISDTVKKANRMVGLIKCSFDYMCPESFLILYKSYVRPHHGICSSSMVSVPKEGCKCHNAIEKVQRRTTKMVPGLQNLSYEETSSTQFNHTEGEEKERRFNRNLQNNGRNRKYRPVAVLSKEYKQEGTTQRSLRSQSSKNIRKHFFSQRVVDS